jgi:hypothetical protein
VHERLYINFQTLQHIFGYICLAKTTCGRILHCTEHSACLRGSSFAGCPGRRSRAVPEPQPAQKVPKDWGPPQKRRSLRIRVGTLINDESSSRSAYVYMLWDLLYVVGGIDYIGIAIPMRPSAMGHNCTSWLHTIMDTVVLHGCTQLWSQLYLVFGTLLLPLKLSLKVPSCHHPFNWTFKYWSKQGVTGPPASSWLSWIP